MKNNLIVKIPMKRIKKVKAPVTNYKKLIKELDAVVGKFIRIRDTDSQGYGNCITCNKQLHFSETKLVNCGHFMSRKYFATRYNEQNMHFQCVGCNKYADGRQYEHGLYIDSRYGEGTAKELLLRSKQLTKQNSIDYKTLIDLYNDKCRAEYNKRGLSYER